MVTFELKIYGMAVEELTAWDAISKDAEASELVPKKIAKNCQSRFSGWQRKLYQNSRILNSILKSLDDCLGVGIGQKKSAWAIAEDGTLSEWTSYRRKRKW